LRDIHQLRSLYGTSVATFLLNAGVLQVVGINDFDTADMLSQTMGRETISYETEGRSEKNVMVKDPERSLSKTQHLTARNLMDPNEIMKLAPDTLLLMRVGCLIRREQRQQSLTLRSFDRSTGLFENFRSFTRLACRT
jgi:type IV secretion system protein VirD4